MAASVQRGSAAAPGGLPWHAQGAVLVAALLALLHDAAALEATARSGRDFAHALANPNVTSIVMPHDVTLADADFNDVSQLPIVVARDVVIDGSLGVGAWGGMVALGAWVRGGT